VGLFSRIALVLGIVCVSSPAWAQLYSITPTGQLFTVNTSNAATTFVGNTGIPNPGSLEFRAADGFLYSMEIGGVPGFWRINPATAAATLVGNPGVFIFEGALQFAPDGTLFGTSRDSAFNPQLFTVNLANGSTTVVGTMSGGKHDVNGLAWRTTDGRLIGLDNFTNSLVVINPATAALSILAPTPELVFATGGMTGFGTSGFYNVEFDRLYSVNLVTGASTFIGQMQIDSIGLAMVPEPSSLAFAAVGVSLLARRRRA
jgi:hypothetical protein